jgi:hypothetical protein
MKINLPEKELAEVEGILDCRDVNMQIAEIYNHYLAPGTARAKAEEINKLMASKHLSEEQAFYSAFLRTAGIYAKDKEFREIERRWKLAETVKLEPSLYVSNSYYATIKPAAAKLGNWELKESSYKPYQGFVYEDVGVDETNDFLERTHFGFFAEGFPFLAIEEKGTAWMSITPHEINTMAEPIRRARGKVLAFGLGLGYFPFMCSLKDEVTEIVVVEKNEKLISLFSESLLPLFPHKEKITIVKADAFDYAKTTMATNHFDQAFVDLWHGPSDGLSLYLRMNKYEKVNKKTEFSYWIEDSILVLLRRCVLTLLEEELNGSSDKDYLRSESESDSIINKLHFLLKNRVIATSGDVREMLAPTFLRHLAAEHL